MSHPLAPGYAIRAPQPEDIDAVYAVMTASEIEEFGDADGFSFTELQDIWKTLDLDHDAWVVLAPDGTMAGYCHVNQRRHVRIDVEGYLHPDHLGRGIGGSFIRLAESWAHQQVPLAPPQARIVVNNWINARNQDACALLEGHGYQAVRFFRRMETQLDRSSPEPVWPEGISVRAFVAGQDDETMYTTMEGAMADHWGHVAIPFETWKTRKMSPSMDPSLWFLAESGDAPAGAAMCSVSEGIGWVNELGVLSTWRRRGLGLALLHHAAQAFHQRGVPRMVLHVDSESPTGATRLYERAGMHVTRHFAAYARELRPGDDLADEPA